MLASLVGLRVCVHTGPPYIHVAHASCATLPRAGWQEVRGGGTRCEQHGARACFGCDRSVRKGAGWRAQQSRGGDGHGGEGSWSEQRGPGQNCGRIRKKARALQQRCLHGAGAGFVSRASRTKNSESICTIFYLHECISSLPSLLHMKKKLTYRRIPPVAPEPAHIEATLRTLAAPSPLSQGLKLPLIKSPAM